MKKFLALLLTFVLALSLVACGGSKTDDKPTTDEKPTSSTQQQAPQQSESKPEESQPTVDEKTPAEKADEIAVGFGNYNGQPIVWRVLTVDVQNEKALLITKDCLDMYRFHETDPTEELTWETSDLRAWLGGEFFDTAFTDEQREKILEVVNPADTNSESGTQGGNDTTDKVFVLSVSEMLQYFIDDADMEASLVGEPYAYWTRTPGDSTQGYVCTYGGGGGLYMTGNWATSETVAVRPAIWVNISTETEAN